METLECGASQQTGKRRVALIMGREELVYDIKNICYIEGHIMEEARDEVRHTVQDVGEEGNEDRVIRMLDLAHADVVERLYPFTEREVDREVLNDRLRDKPVYPIVMNIPLTMSQTTLNLLGKLVHELLVSRVVSDWMSITNPEKEEVWLRKAESFLSRINQIKNLRSDRVRIKLPWG